MIPPAFMEVWQPVSESEFKEFKDDGANPAHFGVSDDEHFEPPSKQMGHKVNIKNSI